MKALADILWKTLTGDDKDSAIALLGEDESKSQKKTRSALEPVRNLFTLEFPKIIVKIGCAFSAKGFQVEVRNAPERDGKGLFFVLRNQAATYVARYVHSETPFAFVTEAKVENLSILCKAFGANGGILLERGVANLSAFDKLKKHNSGLIDGLALSKILDHVGVEGISCPSCGVAMSLKPNFSDSSFPAWRCTNSKAWNSACSQQPIWANFPGPGGDMVLTVAGGHWTDVGEHQGD